MWLSLAHCGCILYDVATLVYYSLKDTVLMHSENSWGTEYSDIECSKCVDNKTC